jgi:hypothetical protein
MTGVPRMMLLVRFRNSSRIQLFRLQCFRLRLLQFEFDFWTSKALGPQILKTTIYGTYLGVYLRGQAGIWVLLLPLPSETPCATE